TAVLFTAGTRTITVTDTLAGFSKGGVVTVIGSTISAKLAVTGFPSPIQPGTPGTFTVTSQDLFGNPTTTYTGTITLSTSDPLGTFTLTSYTFTTGPGNDNGVHVFTNAATLNTSGPQSITVTDTITASITGKQTGIIVSAGAATRMVVTNAPANLNPFPV